MIFCKYCFCFELWASLNCSPAGPCCSVSRGHRAALHAKQRRSHARLSFVPPTGPLLRQPDWHSQLSSFTPFLSPASRRIVNMLIPSPAQKEQIREPKMIPFFCEKKKQKQKGLYVIGTHKARLFSAHLCARLRRRNPPRKANPKIPNKENPYHTTPALLSDVSPATTILHVVPVARSTSAVAGRTIAYQPRRGISPRQRRRAALCSPLPHRPRTRLVWRAPLTRFLEGFLLGL